MNFLSGDASSAFLADDEIVERPPCETDDNGRIRYLVGSDSLIEVALNEVNVKYKIPADREDELAALVYGYVRARKQLEKAIGRWRTSRGKNKYDLAFMLDEESNELYSLGHFVKAYDTASISLESFLVDFETRGEPRVPPWRKEVKKISEYP